MELIWISGSGAWLSEQVIIIKHSTTGYPSPALFSHPTLTKYIGRQDSPTQHSIRAQGDILMTSGGSTPTLRHKTNATHPVFICHNTEQLAYARNYQGYDKIKIGWYQSNQRKCINLNIKSLRTQWILKFNWVASTDIIEPPIWQKRYAQSWVPQPVFHLGL
jgi:hypothetical protein